MKLKADILEKLINDEILMIGRSPYDSTSFAIYEHAGVQVQVLITKDEHEFTDVLLPEYVDAP